MSVKIGSILIEVATGVARIDNDCQRISRILDKNVSTWSKSFSVLKVAATSWMAREAFTHAAQAITEFVGRGIEAAGKMDDMREQAQALTAAQADLSQSMDHLAARAIGPLLPLLAAMARGIADICETQARAIKFAADWSWLIVKIGEHLPVFGAAVGLAATQVDRLATSVGNAVEKQDALLAAQDSFNAEMKVPAQSRFEEEEEFQKRLQEVQQAAAKVAAAEQKVRIAQQAKAQEELDKEIERSADEFSRDASSVAEQASRAIQNASEAGRRAVERDSAKMKSAVTSWASQGAEAIAQFGQSGKVSMRGMVDSIVGDMLRMRAMKLIFEPLLGGLFGTAAKAAGGSAPAIPQAAAGEVFTAPTLAMVGEGGGPGEAAMPLTRMSGGQLGVRATGGGSGVVVQVIDQRSGGAPAQVTSERGPNGDVVRVLIRDEVRRGMADGSFDGDLRRNFGVGRAGVRR